MHAGAPTNVSLSTRSSQSFSVAWNSPTYLEDWHGSFIAYIIKCQSEETETSTYRFGNLTQVTVNQLNPFQVYNCCVLLQTTMANSTETCQQQETSEDGKFV